MDKIVETLSLPLMKRTLRWAVFVVLSGGILIWAAEHSHMDQSISSDWWGGLWWSATSVLTGSMGVGHTPQTIPGQLLFFFLIITGMLLVGVFTAVLTSLFVGEEAEEMQDMQDRLSDQLKKLEAKVDRLGASPPSQP